IQPQAAASIGITRSTNLQAAWGQYAQYPDLLALFSPLGNRMLLPARSVHQTVAIDQRLTARTRVRMEVYQRLDRDVPFQPYYLPRMQNGTILVTPQPLYYNSLRGRSRGFQVFVQRSSANRFSGWISYTSGHDVDSDSISHLSFFSNYDQRHTVNGYGSVRLRPTVNLSLRTSCGSGFPIPAFLERNSHGFYILSENRNQLRLPAYQRTDVRINKTWSHNRWKYTLFAELLNLTNHTNYFFRSSDVVTQQGQ